VTRVLDRPPEPDRRNAAKPLLVFFYSNESGRCRRVEGFLSQVLQARHNHDTFVLHRVEAAERPELIRRFAVERLPTILVIDGKRVRARLEQPRGCAEVRLLLAPWLR
jgi:thioredoxin-like negative regulator of GroEL